MPILEIDPGVIVFQTIMLLLTLSQVSKLEKVKYNFFKYQKLMEKYILQESGKTSIVLFYPDFIDKKQQQELLCHLEEINDWKGGEYTNYKIPRLQKWFHDENKHFNDKWGKSYSRWVPHQYPEWLKKFQLETQDRVSKVMKEYSCNADIREPNINSVLLNYYPDENACIGWHRDNTPALGKNPTIISISIGDTRTFKMCRARSSISRDPTEELFSADLTSGSLLIMAGNCQEHIHSILKSPVDKGPRWNFTFRETN